MDRAIRRCHSPGVAGVTLVELLVGLALAALVLIATYGLIATTMRSFTLAEDLLEVQQSARSMLDRITEEVRWAEAVLPDLRCRPNLLCRDRVTLRVPANNPIQPGADYDVSFRHDTRARELIRLQGRRTDVLGESITLLDFHYFAADGEEASSPEDVAGIQVAITVKRGGSGRVQQRTLRTFVLLRNVRPPAGAAVPPQPAVAETPGAWRPQPRSPSAARSARAQPGQAPASPPAAASSPAPPAGILARPGATVLCPPGPEVPAAAPPAHRDVRNATVQVTDWDIDWTKDRALLIDGEVDNPEDDEVRSVRISATAFAWNGSVVGSASTVVPEIAGSDFEDFALRLPVSQPPVWVRFRIEQYFPRSAAPLHEVVAEIPLSLYADEAKERILVTATVLPAAPGTRHTVCLAVTELAGLPVDMVRVETQVTAPGRPPVFQTLEVPAGETGTSFQLTWPVPVLPAATAAVETVRFRQLPRRGQ